MKYKLKRKFTLWCRNKDYVKFDDLGLPILVCPWWVQILAVWLFSASIYYESWCRDLVEGMMEGLEQGLKAGNKAIQDLAESII